MIHGPGGLRPARDRVGTAIRQIASTVDFTAEAHQPLIDSAEVGPALWNWLIGRLLAEPGPVVVTHGTDTLAFTGAALDAALAGLEVSVVLCGAMQPLDTPGGDAEGNLRVALAAAEQAKPGVWLAISGRLMPAGRVTKVQSTGSDAFQLAGEVASPKPGAGRWFNPSLRVAVLTIAPGLTAESMAAMLAGLDGAVLRVYGAGTLPAALAAPMAEAVARGCRIVAVSQTLHGQISPGAYAAGARLWEAGVISGGAQSVEQALARLWLQMSAAADRERPAVSQSAQDFPVVS
ncbi:MAG: asparaginase domain-containing protein [Tabrizicola sp.]|jgi:L-asparaginase|nr:asparaginase domain-containing protein [Tabrizicola sp.]